MKTLSAITLALALTGGAASAQNPCNLSFGPCSLNYGAPVYVQPYPSFHQPQVSSFPPPHILYDMTSGAGRLRNQNLQLQNELLRRQLQQQGR